MELSPNYAGTLRGIANTFGNTPGFIAPYFVGIMTQDNVSIPLIFIDLLEVKKTLSGFRL